MFYYETLHVSIHKESFTVQIHCQLLIACLCSFTSDSSTSSNSIYVQVIHRKEKSPEKGCWISAIIYKSILLACLNLTLLQKWSFSQYFNFLSLWFLWAKNLHQQSYNKELLKMWCHFAVMTQLNLLLSSFTINGQNKTTFTWCSNYFDSTVKHTGCPQEF